MSLNYRSATFITSAAKLSQLPSDSGYEVAFAGRSNAGKSSALNRLCEHRGLARASKTPGRTQLINLFEVGENRRLVDLPGYGFAKVALEVKKRWQATLAEYLRKRQCLKGMILLCDIRHPLKELDLNMLDWAATAKLPCRVLLSKADKLKPGAQKNTLLAVQRDLAQRYTEHVEIDVQTFSSLKGTGLKRLSQRLDQWFS